jgi:hypothetical protein
MDLINMDLANLMRANIFNMLQTAKTLTIADSSESFFFQIDDNPENEVGIHIVDSPFEFSIYVMQHLHTFTNLETFEYSTEFSSDVTFENITPGPKLKTVILPHDQNLPILPGVEILLTACCYCNQPQPQNDIRYFSDGEVVCLLCVDEKVASSHGNDRIPHLTRIEAIGY